ncbi:MAG TPA: TlpA disulfide reductase family protein [Terracidiphilus sp.]|nr:TlpA disulfide reductase family protein [Terracidiphilus sp.]
MIPVKRNTLVLFVVLTLLAIFGWAGWANWEYHRQAAERRAALAAKQAELIPSTALGQAPGMDSPLLHQKAPAFTLQDIHGNKVSLADFKGKALLLNFWATWCGPCKIETPWLVELRNQYAPQGFEVIGISTEADDVTPSDKAGWAHDRSAIEAFVQQMKVPYPMLMGGDSISKPYGGLEELPTSFFVDRNGTVVDTQIGLTSKDEIESKIRKALGEGK